MPDSMVHIRAHVRDGQVVNLEIRQEYPPERTAAVFWPRPRSVNGVLKLVRGILRIERERTGEAARV